MPEKNDITLQFRNGSNISRSANTIGKATAKTHVSNRGGRKIIQAVTTRSTANPADAAAGFGDGCIVR